MRLYHPEMTMLRRASKAGRKFLNPVPTTIGGFSTIFKVLPRFLSSKEEKFPHRALGPFRTDVSVYAGAPESGLRVTWMGHSSMLVEIDGDKLDFQPISRTGQTVDSGEITRQVQPGKDAAAGR